MKILELSHILQTLHTLKTADWRLQTEKADTIIYFTEMGDHIDPIQSGHWSFPSWSCKKDAEET